MGFQRVGLDRFTGFKSSLYTEGALFYAEKPVVQESDAAIKARLASLEEPQATECPPGGSG